MISSGQISTSQSVFINHHQFELVKKNNDTIYIQTNDPKFSTPEGIFVGQKFHELPEEIKKKFIKENGWGYHYQLKSGWSICFCEGTSCTDKYSDKNSIIKWIFKRN